MPLVLQKADVFSSLEEVFDPELGVDIVSLGLIYDIEIQENGDTNIKMTLTTPYCPLGPEIEQRVKEATQFLPGIRNVTVEIVWDPPWNPQEMASDEAKLELGIY